MNTCWHIALEPIPSRYSEQWLQCIAPEFAKYTIRNHIDQDWSMVDIIGETIATDTTAGGFLNFAATNEWKSSQGMIIANLFQTGKIKPNDVFLFTDAWNPVVLQVRYMSDLLDIPVRIVSYWHAGSYDKWDVLGYKIKDRTWSITAEQSFFHASDVNLFATEYHKGFFLQNCIGIKDAIAYDLSKKCVVSGQPHYEITNWFEKILITPKKENIVLFPHRLCREKQPEIFDELAKRFPDYQFLRTQDLNLSKDDYYNLLLKTKMVFSAAQHEMLGISVMEGVLASAIPFVPDRLSYTEMYFDEFKYPSEWTLIPGKADIDLLEQQMRTLLFDAFDGPVSGIWQLNLETQAESLRLKYLTSEPMFDVILGNP